MKDLSIRDNIKITKADKGGAIVIIDVDNYINEANQQINNKEFYKEISNDPTEMKVNNVIKEIKSARSQDQKIATKLEVQEAKTPVFYMFPKIHKPDNPGRPMISSVNCHRASLSQVSITIYNLMSKN